MSRSRLPFHDPTDPKRSFPRGITLAEARIFRMKAIASATSGREKAELIAENYQLSRRERKLAQLERDSEMARSVQRDRRRGGKAVAEKRRNEAGNLRNTIAQLRKANSNLSNKAAARNMLQNSDPAWLADTDIERDAKVEALLRRVRRAKT